MPINGVGKDDDDEEKDPFSGPEVVSGDEE